MPISKTAQRIRVGSGIILACSLAFYFILTQFIVPASFYLLYDPEIPYFTNSLLPFQGQTYAYYDHPGTPVELLGTFFLGLTRAFIPGSSDQFVLFHLSHPEIFLYFGRTFLALASLVSFFCLARWGVKVGNAGDAFVGIAIAGVFFAVHSQSFLTMTWWSHNSYSFSFGTLLLLVGYIRFRDHGCPGWWSAIGLGAAAGLLSAVTIYLATWVIGLACAFIMAGIFSRQHLLEHIGKSIALGIASLISFILVNLPISSEWSASIKWFVELASHTGRYGTGDLGITTLSALSNMGAKYIIIFPLLFGLILVALLFFIIGICQKPGIRHSYSSSGSFFVAMLIQEAIAVLLVLKHPGEIYMLSAAAILSLLLAAGYDTLREIGDIPFVVKGGLCLIILVGFYFYGSQSIRVHLENREAILTTNAMVEQELARVSHNLGKPVSDLKILETYGVYSKCSALWFGNAYARSEFNSIIGQICRNTRSLSIFKSSVIPDANSQGFAGSDWDVIITREAFLTTFPFASEVGTILPLNATPPVSSYRRLTLIIKKLNGESSP